MKKYYLKKDERERARASERDKKKVESIFRAEDQILF